MDEGIAALRKRSIVVAAVGLAAAAGFLLAGCSANAAPASNAAELTASTFSSVSGHDQTGELDWLATQPLVLSFSSQAGGSLRSMGLKTPCNGLSAPVEVTDSAVTLTDPQRIAATLMGCPEAEAGREAWATAFIQSPMQYALDGNDLTLTTPTAEVRFTKSSQLTPQNS